MKHKPTWWKLYLFAAVTCVVLFLLPPTNQTVLMLWTVTMFGGIVVWLMANQSGLTETTAYRYTVVSPVVAEFFDDDRVLLQQYGSEIPDDNLQSGSHEVV
jgi:hypothetical protein